MTVHVLYTTKATATGGRDGRAATEDGSLDMTMATPKELGGTGTPGNNPEQVFAILDEPVPGRSGSMAVQEAGPVPAAPGIVFSGVSVTYPSRSEPALDGVDLTIPERGVVALVGATGAGKSTITNLLLRFIEPDRGSIVVDGVPLSDCRRQAGLRLVRHRKNLPKSRVARLDSASGNARP